MAVAYRSSATAPNYPGDGGATSLTLDKPVGTAENDILVAVIHTENNPPATITGPGGVWTTIAQESTAVIASMTGTFLWKRAGSSEASTYQFTWTGGAFTTGTIHAFSGATTTGDPFGTSTDSAINATTTIPSLSYTADAAGLAVWFFTAYVDSGTVNLPSGYTLRDTGAFGSLRAADVAQAAGAVNTGTSTTTITNPYILFGGTLAESTGVVSYTVMRPAAVAP